LLNAIHMPSHERLVVFDMFNKNNNEKLGYVKELNAIVRAGTLLYSWVRGRGQDLKKVSSSESKESWSDVMV
jgi:hypothetical protein